MSNKNIYSQIFIITSLAAVIFIVYSCYLVWEYNQLVEDYNQLLAKQQLTAENQCVATRFQCSVGCLYGLVTALIQIDKNITTFDQRVNMTNQCKEFCHYNPDEEIKFAFDCTYVTPYEEEIYWEGEEKWG